jgi:uncharacterized protein (DUF488 family)
MNSPTELWTIGHSRRSTQQFIDILQSWHIEALADVRRFPVSARFPHFSQMQLFKSLAKAGIGYVAFTELGGRRRPVPNSPNTLWRNESFRGFADYMMTPPFRQGIQRLLELAQRKPTAILCAEALWWRCHRSLIADYLQAQGVKVIHIFDSKRTEEHPRRASARLVDGKLIYAPPETLALSSK